LGEDLAVDAEGRRAEMVLLDGQRQGQRRRAEPAHGARYFASSRYPSGSITKAA
jgi:hypothetical protein